jgi:hypothetical protein
MHFKKGFGELRGGSGEAGHSNEVVRGIARHRKNRTLFADEKGCGTQSLPTHQGAATRRQRIEAHLIQRNSNRDMQVRSLPNEQLRLPHVRKTITDVLDALEKIKHEHPGLAAAMGIL